MIGLKGVEIVTITDTEAEALDRRLGGDGTGRWFASLNRILCTPEGFEKLNRAIDAHNADEERVRHALPFDPRKAR